PVHKGDLVLLWFPTDFVEVMPVQDHLQLSVYGAPQDGLELRQQPGPDATVLEVMVPTDRHPDVIKTLSGDPVDILRGVFDLPAFSRWGFPAVSEVDTTFQCRVHPVSGAVGLLGDGRS